LDVNVQVASIVMWSTGTNSWCPCQYQGYRYRWENNTSFLGQEPSMIIMLSKDEEPIRSNDGVWEWSWSTFITSRLISYLVDDLTLST
jgi:hypothetical protein